MFSENLGLKLFSLLLAVVIWIQSLLVTEQRSVVNLPLNLKSIPKNLTLERLPQSIPFSVRGKGLDILKLKLSKTKVLIDASMFKPGVDIISLTDYTIDLPENINVNLIGPVNKQELSIHADVFNQKKVPVRLNFADSYTKQRFEALNYQIIPERIVIFGPKSKVSLVDQVFTLPITREMISEVNFTVKLGDLPDAVSISESEVKVQISNSYNTSKVLDNIPLADVAGKRYFPALIAVKVAGDSKVLKALDSSKIKVTVSPEPDALGLYTLLVDLPQDVQLIAVTPDKVRLK